MSFIAPTHVTRSTKTENVSDWIGHKKRNISEISKEEVNWKDVHSNIKQMDQTYDAAFYAWLKSEENVLVTSIYLQRIANEYPLERIINAMEWVIEDWGWESTSILVKHVTADWCDDKGNIERAQLLKKITENWANHTTAALITSILTSPPYITFATSKRERLLQELTKDWDFSKLSEFFMFLRSKANIDCKFKCRLLQQAAQKDRLSSPFSTAQSSYRHHHKRTSSHDLERSLLEGSLTSNETGEALNDRQSTECYASSTVSSNHTTNHILDQHSSESSTANLSRYHQHLNHTTKK